MPNSEIIDRALLQGYLDNLGSSVVQKMLDMYIGQSEIYLADIQSAINEGSQAMWEQHTHKMKGAAGSVGVKQVHAHIMAIEKSSDNSVQKQRYLEELKQLNNQGITVFKQWLATA
ncbi:Hpt domain-containing protein [Thalassotalea atypica]|uniref:Hpt domain-containing protein n=1 Tax=Thalassotalea atypica TaxID=2054316 RepID=UPI00257333F1|nr:Hpt domain-containing protein [Thalassotalea atypica]